MTLPLIGHALLAQSLLRSAGQEGITAVIIAGVGRVVDGAKSPT